MALSKAASCLVRRERGRTRTSMQRASGQNRGSTFLTTPPTQPARSNVRHTWERCSWWLKLRTGVTRLGALPTLLRDRGSPL
eukprot:6343117-Prymnesium_polylepis.1